jgi:hypothetical protein
MNEWPLWELVPASRKVRRNFVWEIQGAVVYPIVRGGCYVAKIGRCRPIILDCS